jgi:TolB-like protein/class 3 adenylate cyclase
MAEERVRRTLAAILVADVAGYSRLMGEDEESTLRTLKHNREIIDRLIARHEGRIFNTGGDSVLAEFMSAVEGVRCAVAIQEELRIRNAEFVENRRMHFRIGVNVGDVMVDGDNLFGDGVNVAARLEGLAEPGGICVSGTVFDQVRNKLSIEFESIGAHDVKNIAEPVPAFRVLLGHPGPPSHSVTKQPSRWRMAAIATFAVVVIAAAGVVWWQPWAPAFTPASQDRMAFALPDQPSIAVLPFANLSGDKEQAYFADGLTEDIITNLASLPNLFVIARNSTNKFKGKPVDVRVVAEDLGVRYVLEGSVRRAGNRLRITAQLIDALNGHHIWANKYDRELKDVFALQDEMTFEIGTRLASNITLAEYRRRARRGTSDPEAYDLFLRSREIGLGFNPRAIARAIPLIERSIDRDPKYARAYAWQAFLRRANAMFQWANGPNDTLSFAETLVNKAIALDPSDSESHRIASYVYQSQGRSEQAIASAEKAASLSPSNPDPLIQLAYLQAFAGRGDEAVGYAEKALRLNPHPTWNYPFFAGIAYYVANRFEAAVAFFDQARRLNSRTPVPIAWSAAALAQAGKIEQARAAAEELRRVRPGFSITAFTTRSGISPKSRALLVDGLRKAGLPE